jgi:hypothetical protein
MAAIRWPRVWGQGPRDVALRAASFKATEWRMFLLHLLIPLATGRLPAAVVRTLGAVTSALRRLISYRPLGEEELGRLDRAMVAFATWYEATFFRGSFAFLSSETTSRSRLQVGTPAIAG